MNIINKAKCAQFICTDPKKATGIILKIGKNKVKKEEYELMKKDAWFTHLLLNKLIEIEGEKAIDIDLEEIEDSEETQTKVEIIKKWV